jgi:hypothetical protein
MCNKTNLVGVCNTPSGQTLFDGYCFEMSDAQRAAFPPINFYLPGVPNLTVNGPDYLFEVSDQT